MVSPVSKSLSLSTGSSVVFREVFRKSQEARDLSGELSK